jgi:putative transposase
MLPARIPDAGRLAGALSTLYSLVGTKWPGQNGSMTSGPATYPRYRFPAEIISHAVWLYHVFGLSLRAVELILAERGVVVSHESIRQWCLRFGVDFARKRRPTPGDTRHLDEVFLRINGELHYLWRADGVVLDILVQERRNATAAKRLLAGLKYKPRRLVTDGLRSYGAARHELLPEVRHRTWPFPSALAGARPQHPLSASGTASSPRRAATNSSPPRDVIQARRLP